MKSNRSKAIVDRFRCPEEFVHLQIHRTNNATRGFFRFGEDVVCYGRCSYGIRCSVFNLNGNLTDVSSVMAGDRESASLPFDPDEVVDNLRYERYVATANSDNLRSGFVRACRSVYYGLR